MPLRDISEAMGNTVNWDSKANNICLTKDNDIISLNVATNNAYVNGELKKSDQQVEIINGSTMVPIRFIAESFNAKVIWDNITNRVIIEHSSILDSLPYNGLQVEGRSIFFNQLGLPKASWTLPGNISDFRLSDTNVQGSIKEYKYQIIYQQDLEIGELQLTQRNLPNGDNIFFFQMKAPNRTEEVIIDIEQSNQVYGSEAYIYIDNGRLHTLVDKEPFSNLQTLNLEKNYSLDQWYIFAGDSLEIKDPIGKEAWETSLEYHQTNTWVTPLGTHRYTPVEYLDVEEYNHNNINLQASSPLLLIEALEQSSSRLLEDFVHNAKFTLIQMQGNDGFWRTEMNVAYLDRSYGLGDNFIDTRMSVDASLFLLRYGILYDDEKAIEKGIAFKKYFKLLKEKGIYYRNEKGVLYPDYYSESAKSKTLVSLNHALYEINYLYTLYNWLDDEEAKELADEMLSFIKHTYQDWLTEDGDFYYALGLNGEYYGKDYINITYIDLFILGSILKYMEIEAAEISYLFTKKGEYLDKQNSNYPESHLEFEEIYNNFDHSETQKGNITFSYPLDITWDEKVDIAYKSYGAYHFIKGARSINFNGDSIKLDPNKKYMVLKTKDQLHIIK